jgi:hypothetical protein
MTEPCHFDVPMHDYPVRFVMIEPELFELLWNGTINSFPCLVDEYIVGGRVEMLEREWQPTPDRGMQQRITGRELYGWVTHMGRLNHGAMVTIRFSGRTYPMRCEQDVHGRAKVPFPMVL